MACRMNRKLALIGFFSMVFMPIALAVSHQTTDAFDNDITDEINQLFTQQQILLARLDEIERQHARLKQNEETLNEHVLALGGSVRIYRVLQEQRANLLSYTIDAELSDLLADTRLRQVTITQLQRTLRDNNPEELINQPYEQLQDDLQGLISVTVAVQQAQRDLSETSQRLRDTIEEQLFWIPSNPPLNLQWFMQMPQRLFVQVQSLPDLLRLGFQPSAWSGIQILWSLSLFIASIVLYNTRRRLAKYTQTYTEALQRYYLAYRLWHSAPEELVLGKNDAELAEQPFPPSAWLTPKVIGLIALQVLPFSLLILAFGTLLTVRATPGVAELGPALTALALSLFVVQMLYALVVKHHVIDVHFQWSYSLQSLLEKFIVRLAWVLIPASFILALVEQQSITLSDDIIGVWLLLITCIVLSFSFARLITSIPRLRKSPSLSVLLISVLVLLPSGLVVLTVSGYYYTSLQLTGRVLATFYIVALWVIAETTLLRGISLSIRRLVQQRALHAQLKSVEELPVDSSELFAELEPETLPDSETIRQQTIRLGRFLLLLVLGGLLYSVWSDLLTAFGYLDTITVWQYGAVESPTWMTLGDLISAVIIVAITLVLASNLPGVLDMLVLSRLFLQQGSTYAITKLLGYLISSIGLVFALSALGVSWDKLQWLIAALSVGLGFGLQEIFANFISGLIILFERPIRIGDVVTLGNLSGRVRQIHIRATTITDFDRKDIIVPNKTFVTEQLINWSLTDTVTRVIVRVGVAYGSDLDKTKEILLKAAAENVRVLEQPEPQVLFLTFGASTLDHELRIHVRDLKDRNPAIDEINRYIDREFAKAGIEIAFQQVDIRLRNSEGLEQLIERKQLKDDLGD